MKYKLIIQPPAMADLDEAYRWIAERSPGNAARWFNRFLEALSTLEQSPNRCGIAPESEQIGREIRQLLHGRRGGVYRALFVIEKNEVHVLHIRHAARDTMSPEEFCEME
jgi:plasmid stabilization system protein ParE